MNPYTIQILYPDESIEYSGEFDTIESAEYHKEDLMFEEIYPIGTKFKLMQFNR